MAARARFEMALSGAYRAQAPRDGKKTSSKHIPGNYSNYYY
jgi:hypothetical protein